jgi:hypothetical protein
MCRRMTSDGFFQRNVQLTGACYGLEQQAHQVSLFWFCLLIALTPSRAWLRLACSACFVISPLASSALLSHTTLVGNWSCSSVSSCWVTAPGANRDAGRDAEATQPGVRCAELQAPEGAGAMRKVSRRL